METTEFVLECQNLTKKYGMFTALNNLNLQLSRGRIVGLLGPNGSGKTTLIKLINGLLVPTEGQVIINGISPSPATKARVSYLPDCTYLNNWMRVSQIIDYYADFYSDFDKQKAYEMLKSLKLDAKQQLKTMSKGMQEKVQLILVMSRNADLYCLDEPIGGVDPASRDYILRTIISNYNDNSTVLISTHLIADIENVLDDAIFIKDGNLTRFLPVENIREEMGMSVDALFREDFRC